jgi:hypothetical protein
MSTRINVNGKMLDMKELIHGGRYRDGSRNFDVLNGDGFPYGDGPPTEWCKPEKDFGITIRGLDIRHFYSAPYQDFEYSTGRSIPPNVNALKVICIAGGGGGGGGASAHDNDGNGGTAGGGGGGGGTAAGYIPVEGANNFYVEVGGGGSGSNWHYNWGHGKFGAHGSTSGGNTYVQINKSEIGARGGGVGMDHRPSGRLHGNGGQPGDAWTNGNARLDKNSRGNYGGKRSHNDGVSGGSSNQGNNDIPHLDSKYGNGGRGGWPGGNNDFVVSEQYGQRGNGGICRVYFLY